MTGLGKLWWQMDGYVGIFQCHKDSVKADITVYGCIKVLLHEWKIYHIFVACENTMTELRHVYLQKDIFLYWYYLLFIFIYNV